MGTIPKTVASSVFDQTLRTEIPRITSLGQFTSIQFCTTEQRDSLNLGGTFFLWIEVIMCDFFKGQCATLSYNSFRITKNSTVIRFRPHCHNDVVFADLPALPGVILIQSVNSKLVSITNGDRQRSHGRHQGALPWTVVGSWADLKMTS